MPHVEHAFWKIALGAPNTLHQKTAQRLICLYLQVMYRTTGELVQPVNMHAFPARNEQVCSLSV